MTRRTVPRFQLCEERQTQRGHCSLAADRLTRGSAGPAVVTDQAQALHTPDALRAGQESDASLQEGLLSFGLHDVPSPSLDLCRVSHVHYDRNGIRGRLAIYEMSRFPLLLSHSCQTQIMHFAMNFQRFRPCRSWSLACCRQLVNFCFFLFHLASILSSFCSTLDFSLSPMDGDAGAG